MSQPSAEADLLKFLLQAHTPEQETTHWPYVWDPESPTFESYLQQLEEAWPEDITPDFATIAPTLNTVLHQTSPLLGTLQDRFPHAPANVLSHVVSQAQGVGLDLLSLPEQLLQCVQDLFPRWAIEDLQVLGRPYAYAFRSTSPGAQADLTTIEWEQLSEFDQIRLSFMVAKAALETQKNP